MCSRFVVKEKLKPQEYSNSKQPVELPYFVDLWAFALSVETWSFQYVPAYLDGAGCEREGVVVYQNCNSLMA